MTLDCVSSERDSMKSLSLQNENSSATSEAQLVPIEYL